VFAKLTTSDLKMNIRGIGCAAHILHNALRTSADILPVDVEVAVNKIFQYFHIHGGGLRHRRFKPCTGTPREAGTQLYLTLPVANTEGECSFSVLKRVKNRLRSNIGQDKVSELSILFIESSITRN
jgi:hypothetical protein